MLMRSVLVGLVSIVCAGMASGQTSIKVDNTAASVGGNVDLKTGDSTSSGMRVFNSSNTELLRVTAGGNVGINMADPAVRLEVRGTSLNYGDSRRVARFWDDTPAAAGVGAGLEFVGRWNSAGSFTQFVNLKGVKASDGDDRTGNFVVVVNDSSGNMVERFRVRPDGANLIGNLTVTGDLTGARVVGAVFQDVAEWVPASVNMAPGTVVVLNPEKTNEVMPSATAYDHRVAGVVSAQPGVLLGRGGDDQEMIATTGRVKVFVDATAAPIQVGDLLVTSSVPGTAMKSMPVDVGGVSMHRPGTIVGKALEPLGGGKGQILVLLSMQ